MYMHLTLPCRHLSPPGEIEQLLLETRRVLLNNHIFAFRRINPEIDTIEWPIISGHN